MGEVRKISIAITAEQLADIEAAVERGDYVTNSEVIRDALRGWRLREEIREAETARLRALIEEGLASGEAIPLTDKTFDDIRERAMAKLRLERAA